MTLRELRLQAGKSAVEAAKELSVTVSAYAHYEQGVRRLNIEQIRPLAKLYEAGIDDVIEAAVKTLNSCQKAQ